MSVVSVKELYKYFDNVKALDGVSFDIKPGEIFGLLGPDGAGKTTLLRILAGVMKATSGTVEILGKDITIDIEAAKQHIGYLSQKFSLYPDLTITENIDFYSRLFKISQRESRVRKNRLLEFSRLSPYINRRTRYLSGGMKQKLALVCALIHTPQLLILDEPTTGVDPISRREFWRILYNLLSEGVTIIITTPYMDEAERASRVALLYNGKILKCDRPEGLKKEFKNDLAEIITDNNRLTKTLLQQKFGKQKVVFFGDKLHLKMTDYKNDARQVKDILKIAGVNITLMEKIIPGLEDVFIDVIS
jgi:ABC-2 type transport system ATP-binding protein